MGVSTISYKPTNVQLYLIPSHNITVKLHMIYFKSKVNLCQLLKDLFDEL